MPRMVEEWWKNGAATVLATAKTAKSKKTQCKKHKILTNSMYIKYSQ